MVENGSYFKNVLGVEKPTDMEIAMYVLRILSSSIRRNGSEDHHDIAREANIRLAEEALESMTNPFARKLLMDKIKET